MTLKCPVPFSGSRGQMKLEELKGKQGSLQQPGHGDGSIQGHQGLPGHGNTKAWGLLTHPLAVLLGMGQSWDQPNRGTQVTQLLLHSMRDLQAQ